MAKKQSKERERTRAERVTCSIIETIDGALDDMNNDEVEQVCLELKENIRARLDGIADDRKE